MVVGRGATTSSGDIHPPSTSTAVTTASDDDARSLSRRTSVINDLIALFRRSSSLHHLKSQQPIFQRSERTGAEGEDEEDEDDDGVMSKERILEAIQQKREVIGRLRSQPWNMARKRRTLRVAQRHLQRQEAKVSRMELYKVSATRTFGQFHRVFENFKIYLIPWEAKIKRIESHFGSVVSSYFTFLRWVLGVNLTISLIMALFVIVPEWLADSRTRPFDARDNATRHIKHMPEPMRHRADMITTVWDLGGYLQYSLLFYGFYSRETFFGDTVQYRVPVAFFLANIVVLAYSFFIILRKMASNARSSKLSSGKTEQYVFNWKAFTGWDFTIGNPETASNVFMANITKFKEAIAEYNVNMKKSLRWYIYALRVLVNLFIVIMLAFSVWAIYSATKITEKDTFIKQNAVSITVSFITLIYPTIFDLLCTTMERYHPRTSLQVQLGRVLVLYIINYYTLLFSLFLMLENLEEEKSALRASYAINERTATFYEVQHRSLRQILIPRVNDSRNFYSITPPATTPAPRAPWTTVLPDFGPFAISSPRAVVSHERQNASSLFISHPIGPLANWTDPAYIPLNFTGGSRPRQTLVKSSPAGLANQHFRLGTYDDLCWETIIGQEITKLVIMDLIMTVASILVVDFFRGLFIRYFNLYWFWNLEKTFPEYGEFKVAENVLHLANNQGMIWLGLFFVPLLPALNNIKLILVMYIRGWACMTCNVPARQMFRASRSSNFYLILLLLMLFLCTVPVGFVIASRVPSKSCGPFAGSPHFYSAVTDLLKQNLNKNLMTGLNYMSSPGIIIPVMVLMFLVIYFLFALVRALREANRDLSNQLMHERTEEKKKIFELAGRKDKRKSIFMLSKKKNKKMSLPPPPAKVSSNNISSEDESTKTSLPRSTASTRNFVPSLGSVSEVDYSGSEEEEERRSPPKKQKVKLTLWQTFLICTGLADPKKYQRAAEEDIEMTETDERSQLLPRKEEETLPEATHSEHSPANSSATEAEDEERTCSFRTASQGEDKALRDRSISKRRESPRPQTELLTIRPSSSSRSQSSAPPRPPRLQIERASGEGDSEDLEAELDGECSVSSSFQRVPRPGGNLQVEETVDVSTRPPSQDGSLREDAVDDPNLHSSYTWAMLSPIMGMNRNDDSDDSSELSRLLNAGSGDPRSARVTRFPNGLDHLSRQKPPRFRISSSPPKTPTSDKRHFEVRVCASPKAAKAQKSQQAREEGGTGSDTQQTTV